MKCVEYLMAGDSVGDSRRDEVVLMNVLRKVRICLLFGDIEDFLG